MRTVNMHEAKTQLSRLVDLAAKGESFIIAKAGKPMVKVTAISPSSSTKTHRTGFLAGEISTPDDFDRMGEDEIRRLFSGGE
jgi:prevent-host-death family protein